MYIHTRAGTSPKKPSQNETSRLCAISAESSRASIVNGFQQTFKFYRINSSKFTLFLPKSVQYLEVTRLENIKRFMALTLA